MGLTLVQKILKNHLVSGTLEPGSEISIRIDQTLTQDATGTMACLQFETLDQKQVQTELSVNYIDHNVLQIGFQNTDDHRYLETISKKYGMYYSKPGNGICHQVHLERFRDSREKPCSVPTATHPNWRWFGYDCHRRGRA